MNTSVTLTLANTEYPVVLPAGTRSFWFRCRDATHAYRFSFVTGKVATPTGDYCSFAAGQAFQTPQLVDLSAGSLTLYFASGNAGEVIEVIYFK